MAISTISAITKTYGFRFFIIGALVLLMTIPTIFVAVIIDDRAKYSRQTIHDVGNEWGGGQTIYGARIIVPVRAENETTRFVTSTDPETGEMRQELVAEKGVKDRPPLVLYPDALVGKVRTELHERKRGIFGTPVYTAGIHYQMEFDFSEVERFTDEEEEILWDKARVEFGLSDNRTIRGDARVIVDGRRLVLTTAHTGGRKGFGAETGDPRGVKQVDVFFNLNGAYALSLLPAGRNVVFTMDSNWPHPGFNGAFLPDERTVTEDGFTAKWTAPYLAHGLPLVSRSLSEAKSHSNLIITKFVVPNDFYQRAFRAARYSILFIALTFLVIFLLEGVSKRPAHPAQYVLVGLAQSTFLLLMMALAEQIGFMSAYALSSAATIGLLVFYGATGLRLGRHTLTLGAVLSLLYTVLFLILRSVDFALLAGASLSFAALAVTMYATRNMEWGRGRIAGAPHADSARDQ